MLKILKDIPSSKGHRMVEVECSFCGSISAKRFTSLCAIDSCGCNKYHYYDNIGKQYISSNGDIAQVVDVLKGGKALVKFLEYDEDFTEIFKLSHLRAGSFANPLARTVFGVGYSGMRQHKNLKHVTKIRNIWVKMLERCYDKSSKAYQYYGAKNVKVSEDWHNFKNFYDWYIANQLNNTIDYDVDKDLLSKDRNNRMYSPETCCLLPKEINRSLIILPKKRQIKTNIRVRAPSYENVRKSVGIFKDEDSANLAYKVAKEDTIKFLAQKYKNDISEHVYLALLSWSYEND